MSQTVTISTADPLVDRTISILERLFPKPRRFTIRLWDGTSLSSDSGSDLTFVFNHPAALRRMLTPPVGRLTCLFPALICTGQIDILGT